MGKLREDWWTSLQRSKEREIKAWEGEENLFIYKVMDLLWICLYMKLYSLLFKENLRYQDFK